MATPPTPGEDSLREGALTALTVRTDVQGMPAPADSPGRRRLERDRLRELIEDAEREHGPVDPAAVEAKRAILRG
ncbi:hypothetical protein ACGFRB_09620 [Streptomyces sp. NPDC048718]|uniref:hypothetical protein n=1 Tax=Streptomyces sp. NPDC048718 TaxID=3365587 RepID=UPI00371CFD96